MEDLRKPEVFGRYYKEIYKDLYRFALYTLKNSHDAEDAAGEAVADAFASVHQLRDPSAFKNWMFAILSNKCKKKLKEYACRTAELTESDSVQNGPEEGAQVRWAFRQLEDEDRLLISLKVFGGYRSREIGEMIQMNENTVRSRISRGLKKMRELLE